EVMVGHGVNQLGRDAHPLPRFAYAAFQHITHTHLAADVPDLYCLALVGESRVAGDHKQAGDLGQVGGDVFSDAVAEVSLLGVVTHIDEGQDDDGRLIREWQLRR